MKSKRMFILSVAVSLVTVLLIVDLAAAGLLAKPQLSGGAPTMVSYQGQVVVGGVPYNGAGFFKFAIVDVAGSVTYWSNDGTSSAGGEPAQGVSLTVISGLFDVLLGDTTLANMTQPLTAAAFNGAERYLRVWFSADGSSYQQLNPDKRIAAVPYALQAQVAADADKLDGLDWADLLAQFGDACPVGSSIRAVNMDGTPICQPDSPLNRNMIPTTNTYTTVDDGGAGRHTSITIGADGLGLVSYQDFDATALGTLKVVHCEDQACTVATATTLDSALNVGWYTSLAIGTDGLGLISYFDENNDDLKVAHCDNLACTSATINTLDSAERVGAYTAITIGPDGLGLIAYYDLTHASLKVAHCNDVICSSAMLSTLDSGAGQVGVSTSITLGVDGLGLIGYYDRTNQDLKVAHCNNVACTSATLSTIDSAGRVGGDSSVTIGVDGLGLISYVTTETNHDLKVAHCNDLACTSATITTVDGPADVGFHSSMTIGADGLGLISYQDWTNTTLKVAHCNDLACTSASTLILDNFGVAGGGSSITIGVDGLGLISHGASDDLRVVHCGSIFCVDFFRRR